MRPARFGEVDVHATRWLKLPILGALSGALLAIIPWGAAAAGPAKQVATIGAAANEPATEQLAAVERYFVDFRSRSGYLFGHTFIVFGQIDEHGRPTKTHYAGNYPIDGQRGLILGSLISVPSSVRGVREDYKERPTNIYRRRLSPAEFAKLKRVVSHLRASKRQWNLLFQNCNDFAIEVAHRMGMETPLSWLPPSAFIDSLREMNKR
jgi:hypothetical protein